MTQRKSPSILLVEDNLGDAELMREGLSMLDGAEPELHHVWNGKECLAFLRKEGSYSDAPTPHLIVLDLNMPIMDGRETLQEIVDDPGLRHLPVVVLTTSGADSDVMEMHRLRCSSYVVKPVDFSRFLKALEQLSNYWFTTATLPS